MWGNTYIEEQAFIHYYFTYISYTQSHLHRMLRMLLRTPKVSFLHLKTEKNNFRYCTEMSQKFLNIMKGKLMMMIKETVKILTVVIRDGLWVVVIYFNVYFFCLMFNFYFSKISTECILPFNKEKKYIQKICCLLYYNVLRCSS